MNYLYFHKMHLGKERGRAPGGKCASRDILQQPGFPASRISYASIRYDGKDKQSYSMSI